MSLFLKDEAYEQLVQMIDDGNSNMIKNIP